MEKQTNSFKGNPRSLSGMLKTILHQHAKFCVACRCAWKAVAMWWAQRPTG